MKKKDYFTPESQVLIFSFKERICQMSVAGADTESIADEETYSW